MLRPVTAHDARLALGLDPQKTTVVVMGGSQGARSLNEAVATLVTGRELPADWQILHVSGARDFAGLAERERDALSGSAVRLVEYLEDPRAAYAAADLVVARSGASTLGELAATGTPALLVPFPFATADHQAHNAAAFARGGAAHVVADRELDAQRLFDELQQLLQPERLAAMRAAAHDRRADPRAAVRERVKRWLPAKNVHP
jgi:UDP-N-acetylglucosamine--N-acetylmuramyl-(pentapeptide) pyrophosphoryl-undecaprenol N-acetylglucosamine transferase